MTKLEALMALACSVTINANDHRNGYETVAKAIADERMWLGEDEIDAETEAAMLKRNQMVQLIVYPRTPVGCITIWSDGLDDAVDEAIPDVLEAYEEWIHRGELPDWHCEAEHLIAAYKELGGRDPDRLKELLGMV